MQELFGEMFSEKEKQSKINGYKLCDSELGLSEKKYTVSKQSVKAFLTLSCYICI
jgi:hypothetical protein